MRSRWHLVYFLLAGLQLATVTLSLFLSHRLIERYRASLDVNREWARRSVRLARLSQLAAAANAPGNNVFETRDPQGEEARAREAAEALEGALEEARVDVQRGVREPEAQRALLLELDRARAAAAAMTAESRLLFQAYAAGDVERAGRAMAAMDRRFGELRAAAARMVDEVRGIQEAQFQENVAASRRLAALEAAITLAIVALALAASLYGLRMRRQALADAAERERHLVELRRRTGELERRNREIAGLVEMGDELQACEEVEEAYAAAVRYLERVLAGSSGRFYAVADERPELEAAASWGRPASGEWLAPGECWALRRGRPHAQGGSAGPGPRCAHVPAQAGESVCAPLLAHGLLLGLLHVECGSGSCEEGGPADGAGRDRPARELAVAAAEQVALVVAGLRLRESLRRQSIRDPLTGLFNRRYLEETLLRELPRARREGRPVGLLLADLDHFKRLNDARGHAAGDAVLRAVGELLLARFRDEDVACRYGGEELALVLPGTDAAALAARGEELRAAVRALRVPWRDGLLEPVTVSVGGALFPDHAGTGEGLLRAADAALYRAKEAGRDRVVVAAAPAQSA